MHVKQLPPENSSYSGRNIQRGPDDGILQSSYAKTCLEIRLGSTPKSADRGFAMERHQAPIFGTRSAWYSCYWHKWVHGEWRIPD